MAWQPPSVKRPVWCAVVEETSGLATAGSVRCVTNLSSPSASGYKKFTNQRELGDFLLTHYKIHTPRELTSCEVCHR
jgi:hypothetical protein